MQLNLFRKSLLLRGGKLALIVLLSSIVFTNCKKSASPQEPQANPTLTRVIAWLDAQKQRFNDSSNRKTIASIKENLVTSEISEEEFGKQQKIIIVPLKKDFKTINVTSQQSFKNLVIFENPDHSLGLSNIIEIIPKNQPLNKVPVNMISKILIGEDNTLNGIVSFMSLTRSLMTEREYKDGKIYSLKYLVKKEKNVKEGDKSGERINLCIDWYWEYYVGGVKVYEEFAFTTCDGGQEPCMPYRSIDAATPFKSDCGGGGGGEQQSYTLTDQITDGAQEADDDAAIAPTIKYSYHATVTRQVPGNQIISVVVDPTTADPMVSWYTNAGGQYTRRQLTLFGHANTFYLLTPTSAMIEWGCFVHAWYSYDDGTSRTRQWFNTKIYVY